ncbi:unnamed protein product, partial [Didymodactylos carnosus]
ISDILEKRGWIRTKDRNFTQYTIKWCLERNVDWSKFEPGQQLVNNIPGQIYFADKVNLWYTIREYIIDRRQKASETHIHNFLPMTFVLDNENEVNEFLRVYKKHNRTWICKPRYSYAGTKMNCHIIINNNEYYVFKGRGIYVITVNSDLNTIFKLKVGTGNRLQYQPKVPGYLMQEQSVQENHYRYAFSQENTGMTMTQLNHYFNQCFRPFNPNMCEDWVMKVMQTRMQSIIRHVIRASKDKLTCTPGFFGIYGCDFLLDENFRIWLLEVNDNPGVGWGNTRVNTTTKPLFEETLDIVWECFQKNKNGKSLLPIECLKNYQLIYNEDDDNISTSRDESQSYIQRSSVVSRYTMRDTTNTHLSRARVKTAATITVARVNDNQNESSIQKDSLRNLANITNEPLKHDDDIELERLETNSKVKQSVKLPNRSRVVLNNNNNNNNNTNNNNNNNNNKRPISVSNSFIIRRKREIILTPMSTIKKRHLQRNSIQPFNTIQQQQQSNKNTRIPLKRDDVNTENSSDATTTVTNFTSTITSTESTVSDKIHVDKSLKLIAETSFNESSLNTLYEQTYRIETLMPGYSNEKENECTSRSQIIPPSRICALL